MPIRWSLSEVFTVPLAGFPHRIVTNYDKSSSWQRAVYACGSSFTFSPLRLKNYVTYRGCVDAAVPRLTWRLVKIPRAGQVLKRLVTGKDRAQSG